MWFPTFLVGPTLGLVRNVHQSRRRVRLTVHRGFASGPMFAFGDDPPVQVPPTENLYITVTNASRDRDIVVTHVWLETVPPVHVIDADLSRRLRHSDVWETMVPVSKVPAGATDVEWLARCMISPDDKVIKSRPRRNVPPAGMMPRGGSS